LVLVSIAVGVACLSVLVVGQNINAINVTGNISPTASGIKNNTSAGNKATNNTLPLQQVIMVIYIGAAQLQVPGVNKLSDGY
jgi:glutathione synthase/RimK-type ligase-like ATP-grasp enzyme